MDLISWFFVISWLIVWVVGIKCGWCLAQGRGYWPPPDLKCNLIISSFLTLSHFPHLLDYLICTRNAMSIALVLQIMGERGRWEVVNLYYRVGNRAGRGYHVTIFVFYLVLLYFVVTFSVPLFRWIEHDGCCVCFFVFSLFSLSLIPLTRSY